MNGSQEYDYDDVIICIMQSNKQKYWLHLSFINKNKNTKKRKPFSTQKKLKSVILCWG